MANRLPSPRLRSDLERTRTMALANCLKCGSSDIWIRRKRITCNDGVTLSVQVGDSLYCSPRDNSGEYTTVEVGFISKDNQPLAPPDSWEQYSDGSFPSDVYGYVPVSLVEAFIAEHGGRRFWV